MNIFLLLFPVFVFFKDGKWGLVNSRGEVVKQAVFDELEDPNKQGFAVANFQGKYGLLDSSGNFVLPPSYQSLEFISDSFLIGRKDSISFICNIKGEELTNSQFENISYNSNGNQILHTRLGKTGMILKGRFLLPIYDSIWFSDRFWLVEKDKKRGVYDGCLNQILSEEFEEIKPAFNYLIAKQNGLFGLFDLKGKNEFPCRFSKIELIDGNHMVATDAQGKAKLYDLARHVSLAEGKYDKIRFLPGFDYLFLTEKDGLEGLLDAKGKVLIENKYDEISFIGLDRLAATDSLGDHMYTLTGKKLSKIPLGEIQAFDTIPVTKVQFNNQKGAVNKQGEVLLLPKYSYVDIAQDKIVYVENGRKNVITFDENGGFLEVIKNFGTIRITDTSTHDLNHSYQQRTIVRTKGDRFGMTVLRAITVPVSRNGSLIQICNFFLFDSTINRTIRSLSSFLDISLKTINLANVAPAITTAGKLVLINRKGSLFSTLTYKTVEGKRQTKPFGSIGQFSEGLAPVNFANSTENYKSKYQYKLRDTDKKARTNTLQGVLDGLETNATAEEGNWGFINQKGDVVIPPQFARVQGFQNGHSVVKSSNGQYGLINASGTDVWNANYMKVEHDPNSDSLYLVHKPCYAIGFMDKSFTMAFAPKYKDVKAIGNRLVLVKCKNRLWAYKKLDGTPATDSVYGRARSFSEGLAAVYHANFWNYIDTNGRVVLKAKYTSASDFVEGRAFVTINGKPKIINLLGHIIAKGDLKGDVFVDGFAVMAKNKKFGILQLDGDWLVEPHFESITRFDSAGIAIGTKQKKRFVIKKTGEISEVDKDSLPYQITIGRWKKEQSAKEVFYARLGKSFPNIAIPEAKALYQHQSFEDSEYVPYKPATLMGLVSEQGKIILQPIYQCIRSMGEGVFKVYHHNSVGYFSLKEGWLYRMWI